MAAPGLGKMKNKKNQDVKKPYDRPKSLLSRFSEGLRELFSATRHQRSAAASLSTDTANMAERTDAEEEAAMDTGNRHQTSEDSGFNTRTTADGVVLEYGGYQATFDSKYDRYPTESETTTPARPGSSPLQPTGLNLSGFGFTKQQLPDHPQSTPGPSSPGGPSCVSGFSFTRRSPDLQPSSSQNSPGEGCSADLSVSGKRPARVLFSDAGTSESRDKYKNPCKKQCVTPDIRDPVNRSKPPRETSPTDRSFLWCTRSNRSHKTSSSALGRGETIASKKPRFDLDTFESSLRNHETSLLSSNHRQSPYYLGKTTYGGASARQKLFRHLDAKCKVVPTVQHKVQVQPASLATGQAMHSATSQKILNTLEQFGSGQQPGLDLDSSHRSGSTDSPLFFNSSAYRQNSTQATGRPSPANAGPPVHDRPAPTRAIIRDNVQNSRSLANVTPLSNQSMVAQSSRTCGKTKEPTSKHYVATASGDDEEEMDPGDELAANTVVTMVSSGSTATSSGGSASEAKTASQKTSMFTFSLPISVCNSSGFNACSEPKNFQFRSPIAIDDRMASSVVSTSMEVDPTSSSGKSSLAMNFNLDSAVKKPAPPMSSTTSPSAGASGFGGFAPAKELKTGGVMDFLGKSTSSAPKSSGMSSPASCADASQTVTANESGKQLTSGLRSGDEWSKPQVQTTASQSLSSAASAFTSPASAVSKPLSELFKASTDVWSCPTCFVSNSASASVCPCCETKKPGGTSTVPVAASTVKAPATSSETEKPNATSGANLPSLAELFKKPAGEWTCPVCCVPNKAADLKCCACEEPKPGAAKEPLTNSNMNNSMTSTSSTHITTDGSSYKFSTATFGNGSQSASSISAAGASGVMTAPLGGFSMSVPAGGFSGFSFGASFQPTEKGDSVAAPAGGFKLPAGFTGFGIMKPSDSNVAVTGEKQKTVSFAVTSSSSENPSGSENAASSLGNGGFSFKSNVEHVPGETQGGFSFNSASFGSSTKPLASAPGFQIGAKSSESATTVSQSPLDSAEKDKNLPNSAVVAETLARPSLSALSSFDGAKSSTGAVTAPLFDGARSGSAFGIGGLAESKVGFANPFGSQGGGFGGILPAATSLASSSLPQTTSSASSSAAAAAKTVSFGQSSATGIARTGDAAGPNVFSAGPALSNPSDVNASIFKFGQPPSYAPGGAPSTEKSDENAPKDGVSLTSTFGQTTSTSTDLFKLGPTASDANRATAPGFSFGQSQPSQETKPSAFGTGGLFVFGQQPQQSTASSSTFQFGFGAANPPSTQPFGFADNKSISTPAFGQPSTAAAAAASSFNFVAPKFSVGAAPSEQRPTNSSTHQGTKRSYADNDSVAKRVRASSEDMQMQDEPAASGDFAPSSTSTGFGFGCQQQQPATCGSVFGGALSNPGSAFQAAPPMPAPSFSFTGQQQTGFGAQSATNMGNGAVSTGVSFGANAAPQAPAFNFSPTPNFNFTGMPANQPTNVTFNAQATPGTNPARVIKKAVRRTNRQN